MDLGRSDLVRAHRGLLTEKGHDIKRFGCSSMLYVTWLRLAEEVISHAMSQQASKLLLWDTGLLGKLPEGGSSLEGDNVFDVVFENSLQADRCGKPFMPIYCPATTRSLMAYRLSDYGLNWPLIEPP